MISFKENWQRIRHILALSFVFAKVKFKLKNEGSYLGIFWYLLSPILTFLILFFIFSDRLGNDIYLYPIYLLLGIIIFNFFQYTTLEAARNIHEDKA
ncbi:MAG: ABC transporter permease, partial [Candidatus Nealsonbacteria bacterium]|nr:ABC transporter permease [Candidatus Nealsonbacteria bacterium]